MMECCDNCKFSYGPLSVDHFNLKFGRYPPKSCQGNKYESCYSWVSSADWCGEWKAKEV